MKYNLDKNYTFWYHSIKNNNWNKNSYIKIFDIKNLFDYKLLNQILKKKHLQNGMFFIMKDNIFPNWEHPDNREGGCLSFKISSMYVKEQWDELFLFFIYNHFNNVNGISISPKKEFNIIKIWIKNDDSNYKIKEINDFYLNKNTRYKKHDIIL
jgi:hypothetical protein